MKTYLKIHCKFPHGPQVLHKIFTWATSSLQSLNKIDVLDMKLKTTKSETSLTIQN